MAAGEREQAAATFAPFGSGRGARKGLSSSAMDRTLRLILTMLALLAGFAAAPAQARMSPADTAELERVEGGRAITGSSVSASSSEVQGQIRGERRDRAATRTRRPATVIVLIPSIQYGDRSLE